MRRHHRTRRGPELAPDEELEFEARPSLLLSLPRIIGTLGLYELWRKRDTMTVTDHRVMLGHGVLNRYERVFPLSRVRDVSFNRRGIASYADVGIEGPHGEEMVRFGPLSSRRAHTIASRIGRHLG